MSKARKLIRMIESAHSFGKKIHEEHNIAQKVIDEFKDFLIYDQDIDEETRERVEQAIKKYTPIFTKYINMMVNDGADLTKEDIGWSIGSDTDMEQEGIENYKGAKKLLAEVEKMYDEFDLWL